MHRASRLRRLVGVLVPLALLASACGDDEPSDPAVDVDASADRCPVDALDDAEGTVAIDFWHAMTAANETMLTQLTDEYNASQDRVAVTPLFQGTYDETGDKLLGSLRGGNLPAIVQLEETRIRMGIDSRAMLPVQTCIDAADYDLSDHLEPVIDQFTVEDVLWPMPFNTSNPVLYYNLQAFERAGLGEADVPTTLEELRSVSQQLVDAGATPYGLSLELRPWYVEQWFAKANQPLVDNDNGRSGRETGSSLDSEIGAEIYEWLDGMVDDGLATSVGRNEQGIEHFLSVATGDAAMTIGTSAALGTVVENLSGGQFPDVTMGVAPMPGGDEGGVLVGGAALWLLDRDTSDEEKAAAWDYVAWLNEPEQQARWHAGTGYIPNRKAAVELPEVTALWEEQPYFRVAYDQLLASSADFGGPVIGDYAEFRERIIASMERLVLEDAEPSDVLASVQEETDEVIRSYNDRVGG